MWMEFEWENKINISSKVDPVKFLENVMKETNFGLVGRNEVKITLETSGEN
jgi:hypothetical protein